MEGEPQSPACRLTASTNDDAELDALGALEVVLGGAKFWNPQTLTQASTAVIERHIERSVGETLLMKGRLVDAKALQGKPAWERAVGMAHVLYGALEEEGPRRALCYAAGVPMDLVVGVRLFVDECALLNESEAPPEMVDALPSITWLPEGLVVPAGLSLEGQGITSLPTGLVVGGDFWLWGTTIRSLPNDLVVNRRLVLTGSGVTEIPVGISVGRGVKLDGCPLSRFTEDEIRAKSPGIRGEIER